MATLIGSMALNPGISKLKFHGSASLLGLMSVPLPVSHFKSAVASGKGVSLSVVGTSRAGSSWADTSIKAFSRNVTLTNKQLHNSIQSVGVLAGAIFHALGL